MITPEQMGFNVAEAMLGCYFTMLLVGLISLGITLAILFPHWTPLR